jgi:LmbE family N-acetylglucosaminyl deacetylase
MNMGEISRSIMRILTIMMFVTSVVFYAISFASVAHAANGPDKVMYFFAHEDDDLDVTTKIMADLKNGRDDYMVRAINGDLGGPPDAREKEAREMARQLKVPESNLLFLGYHDQQAYKNLFNIYTDLLKIAEKLHPIELTSHAYEGGNIDHDSNSLVATYVTRKLGIKHLEFPDNSLYEGKARIWKFLPDGKSETLFTPMDSAAMKLKFSAVKIYKSQAQSLTFYLLQADRVEMKTKGEPYRVAPDYDYTKQAAAELHYAATSHDVANVDMFLKASREFVARMDKENSGSCGKNK